MAAARHHAKRSRAKAIAGALVEAVPEKRLLRAALQHTIGANYRLRGSVVQNCEKLVMWRRRDSDSSGPANRLSEPPTAFRVPSEPGATQPAAHPMRSRPEGTISHA